MCVNTLKEILNVPYIGFSMTARVFDKKVGWYHIFVKSVYYSKILIK